MQIKTPAETREYILSQGITIVPGQAYGIFNCGHVYKYGKGEERFFKVQKKTGTRVAVCGICKEKAKDIDSIKLLTKFRDCPKCGERSYLKLPPNECYCVVRRQNIEINAKLSMERRMATEEEREEHRKRYDCTSREKCLNEFVFSGKHGRVLECAKCDDYISFNDQIKD